jgi:hypothetical protein
MFSQIFHVHYICMYTPESRNLSRYQYGMRGLRTSWKGSSPQNCRLMDMKPVSCMLIKSPLSSGPAFSRTAETMGRDASRDEQLDSTMDRLFSPLSLSKLDCRPLPCSFGWITADCVVLKVNGVVYLYEILFGFCRFWTTSTCKLILKGLREA